MGPRKNQAKPAPKKPAKEEVEAPPPKGKQAAKKKQSAEKAEATEKVAETVVEEKAEAKVEGVAPVETTKPTCTVETSKPADGEEDTEMKEPEKPKKQSPKGSRAKSAVLEEAKPKFAFNFKGEKYPLKYMLWSYLKNHRLTVGNEVSESFETNDLYLTI